MVIRYCFMIFSSLLILILSSCNKHKKMRTVEFYHQPENFQTCSEKERLEIKKRAESDYPFTILQTTDEVDTPRFCKRIRTYLHAMDVLPLEVKYVFDRVQEKSKLKIYIVNESFKDLGMSYPDDASGLFVDHDNTILIKIDSDENTLWHEIGHALDFNLYATFSSFHYLLSFTDEFTKIYNQLKEGEGLLEKNAQEGFAYAFQYFVFTKVYPQKLSDRYYQKFKIFYHFFDVVFKDVERSIKCFHGLYGENLFD